MKLSQIASQLGLELRGDGETEIAMPAPIEAAGSGMITFAVGRKYAEALSRSGAAAAIVPPEMASDAQCPVMVSDNPAFDFARVLGLFFPPLRPSIGIDPTAFVAADAGIGENASVGPHTVVQSGVSIGRNATIHPNVTIYPNVCIGDDFTCHSQVSIREGVTIGNRVTVLNGAVIGAEGFGFVEYQGGIARIPQVGTVVIEDDVEIGANTTIDRATMGATIIRRGVKLDNLVQVGHNCEIGEFTRMSGQAGLSGSVKVGKWSLFGGQAGCADHVTIGDRARISAQAGVHKRVPDDGLVGGTPAIELRTWRRMAAVEPRLPELMRRIRALEQRVDK